MVIEKRVSKALVLDNNTAEDVARAMIESGLQKNPFYIFDMDKAYQRIEYFKKMMPRIKIFYAVKSNDSDFMLKLAASLGLGFDCASPGEIHKVLKLKVSPLLLLRIRVHSDSVYDLGKKFGCDFETEATDLLEEAALLNLKVVGVAFHVGSGCSSPDSYVLGLQQVKKLFEHEAKAGRQMKIVDIGGGFLSDRTNSIDKVSKLVNDAIEELFPDPDIQVISEPGRYLCDNSFTLYCNINTVRTLQVGDSSINMLYLNDGVFGCLRYNEPWHTVQRFQAQLEGEELKPTVLWGPTCHPIDRILDNTVIMLPPCTINDWLVFPSRGAYSMTMASRFSTLPEPHIRSVISQELWNIIKDSKVFSPDDFLEQNIATPLPTTLPSIIVHSKILQTNYTLSV
ncbi:unnamed protein product [Danaus chrysippus]|uniref:ornithine decarboxylase n=1 Tax=Danaus chrysippus TaxID=151541 RepID=A0A8J2W6B7_9NEOP|nr:unnamed protein product [Danaus chrysippus]